jgi:prepilin-type N-terminal cleavage/methylation domain-containing protein
MRRDIKKLGFTLIENMISMMLLTIVLTAGLSLYHNANQFTKLAVHKKIATELVNSRIETFKKDGYGSLPLPSTPEILTLTIGGLSAQQTATITDIDEPVNGTTDYKKIQVEVVWTEAGRNTARKIESTTYIAP